METGKTGKYFKYAIGEVILVVVGILIALQINNWNENQKERKLETEILKEIKENLSQDIINIKIKINETNSFKLANNKILEHLENRTPLSDSLQFYYARLQGIGTFREITAGYENLKSKGVDIIKNKALRNAITKLYDFQYFYIVEDLEYAIDNFRNNKASYFSDKVFLEKNKGNFSAGKPINLESLYNDKVFIGHLKNTIEMYDWMNIVRNDGIKQIEDVIQVIDKEHNK